MKNYISLAIPIIFYFSCHSPSKPAVESPVGQAFLQIPTDGYAVDLDVEGNVMAVAANYDGYYLFDVAMDESTGHATAINETNHVTGEEMNPNAGDNRAEEIHVSLSHNAAFIVDRFDKIMVHKLAGAPYLDNNLPICVADVWLSLAYDDTQEDTLLFYPLVKHNSAIGGAGFDAYSASVVYSQFWEFPEFEEFWGTTCEFGVNFSILAEKIIYSDSLLTVAMGELGLTIYKQNFNGSIDPMPFAQIDTPGEVYSVHAEGHTVFAGLSYYKGCYMALLDNQGNIENNLTFAEGSNVRGIDSDGDLIALACGYDGVLIYEWQSDNQMKFLGSLETGYANAVAVQQNTVFAATRDGIEVFNIERN